MERENFSRFTKTLLKVFSQWGVTFVGVGLVTSAALTLKTYWLLSHNERTQTKFLDLILSNASDGFLIAGTIAIVGMAITLLATSLDFLHKFPRDFESLATERLQTTLSQLHAQTIGQLDEVIDKSLLGTLMQLDAEQRRLGVPLIESAATVVKVLSGQDEQVRHVILPLVVHKYDELIDFLSGLTGSEPNTEVSSVQQTDISKRLVADACESIIFYEPVLVDDSSKKWSQSFRDLLEVIKSKNVSVKKIVVFKKEGFSQQELQTQIELFKANGFDVLEIAENDVRDLFNQYSNISKMRIEMYDHKVWLKLRTEDKYADNENVSMSIRTKSIDRSTAEFITKLVERATSRKIH